MRAVVVPLSLFAALLVPGLASAHTTLVDPAPRTLSNKDGPCGATGSMRGDVITVFEPGETITVVWDETVDHPGHYRIAFDESGDDDFPDPVSPDDDFPSVLADQIPDRSGGGMYSQKVTLPDVECEDCTLQLIQIMTTQVPYNSFYFQCADIALRAGSGGGGGGEPSDDGGCQAGGSSALAWPVVLAMLLALRRRTAILARARGEDGPR